MSAGSGRASVGAVGGWLLRDPFYAELGAPFAGGGAELSAAWAPGGRVAFTAAAGVGGLTTSASGWAGLATARWLALDDERVRLAPWVAGGALAGAPFATGGLAVEVPFHAVLVDASVPLGGATFGEAGPAFLATPLLAEVGFTWRIGDHTTFRLGYLAAAASWSWRWHDGPWTIEVGGYTNVLSGNLSTRVGRTF